MPASRNLGYKAGQYVLLQVPVLSRWQWHPFTIFTCIANELQLHIKTDGNWTGKLRKLGTSLGAAKIKIGIDGPCGAPAQRFYNFEQTIIVGAGIGITPFSGILTDLQAKEEQRIDLSSSDLETYKRVDFHWMVRDRNNLLWFSDLLNYISVTTASSSSPSNIDFRITTYVTQKRKSFSTHIFRWLLEKYRTPEHPESLDTGLINATHFGRPDMKTIMNKHYEDMCVLLVAKKDLYRN
ncbi:hypothetical protein KCU73_g6475, partial [Aureobasidium melanogenum]